MILRFEDWSVSAAHDALGYQLDNETRELTLLGDLPQGWTWDVLVQAQGKTDIWPLALTDEGAKFTLTDENLSIKGPYCLQVRGTKGSQVRHCNAVTVYVLRTLAGTVTWPTLPTEFAQAEKNIKELNAHPPVPGENGYWMLWDLETSAYIESQLSVPVGPAGPANTLQIGTVETLEPGQTATAQITGEAPDQTLSLGIPQGQTGKTGATPALEIGQVETLEPGQPATAEFSGTPEKPVLSLGIPQGQPGKDGPANTLQIGTVETLEPGQAATAQIIGEAPNQTLSLGIPQGQTGQTGATPALEIGQVETLEPGEPATAELSGTPEAPVLSLGIPRGEPGEDGVQLNDDAINTTEAWSSKKIVDTLCPAFTAEGNPVTCSPVEDYPLSAVVTLEPKQAGTGDPSPENVRPISGYDSVAVNIRGRNLCDPEEIVEGILNSTGEVVDNPNYKTTGFIAVVAGAKVSRTTAGTTGNFFYDAEKNFIENITSSGASSGANISVPENSVYWRFSLDSSIGDIMANFGEALLSYEPYQPGTTATITLPETIYGGTVDAVTGVGSEEWKLIEFDGTESWEMNVNNIVLYTAVSAPANTNPGTGYCSHFPFAYNFGGDNIFISVVTIYLGTALSAKYTLESWKSYLAAQAAAGTPVQVAYKLATPEPFQATGNQALPAVAGLNTVYTDGDSLTVTGRRDLVSALEDLQTTMTAVTTLISEGGLT